MHIALNGWFLNRPDTGSGQYVQQLLRAMEEVCPECALQVVVPAGFGCKRLEIRDWRFAGSNLQKLWFEQIAFPAASRKADVAFVPYFAAPLFPRVPTVVTIHDLIPLLLPAYRGSVLVQAYTRLVAAGVRRASAIITDSQASKRDIVRHLGIPAERVHAIYLAADARFRPPRPAEIEAVRRKYGLPERYVLYLGGFDVRKNVPTLLRAFARLSESRIFDLRSPLCLVIAGRLPRHDTPFTPDPRHLTCELGITDRVAFPGWIDEMDKPGLYGGAVLFIYPSKYEGFGLPPLEAMACGTPVIVSNAASLPEVVGEAGLTVPPHDADALADAMAALLTDDERRHVMREAGLEQAHRFSWERTAVETEKVLRTAYCVENTQYAVRSTQYATGGSHERLDPTPRSEP